MNGTRRRGRLTWALPVSGWLILSLLATGTPGLCATAPSKGVTLSELKRLYPNACFVAVDPDQLAAAAATLRDQGVPHAVYQGEQLRLAQADAGSTRSAPPPAVPQPVPASVNTNAPPANTNAVQAVRTNAVPVVIAPVPAPARPERAGWVAPYADARSCDGLFDLFSDIHSRDDAAVVLFVVIGAVVVVALIVYAGAYVYNMLRGDRHYTYWWDLQPHAAWITGRGENGFLTGLKLSSGFVQNEVHAGLAVEAGYLNMDVKVHGQPDRTGIDGVYGLIGPAIRWQLGGDPVNPASLSMEFLGGATESSRADLMSVARAALSVGIGSYGRVGVSLGAMYLDLRLDQGLTRRGDQFTLLLGTEFGLRF